jgi:HAD superfamily hydrolase (TIGR01484 family)
MDKTITPARSPIESEMFNLLRSVPTTITVISGGTTQRIKDQTNDVADFILGACGNEAYHKDGTQLWKNDPLTEDETAAIEEHIATIVELVEHDLNPDWNPIEHRGSQITFSPLGNTAPTELKHSYDPDMQKRLGWLEAVPLQHPTLSVVIGGSTSLDYYRAGCDKGAHVAKLIAFHSWDPATCVYFGDGLYPGGNDESVIGVIDTIAVSSPEDTQNKLQTLFAL